MLYHSPILGYPLGYVPGSEFGACRRVGSDPCGRRHMGNDHPCPEHTPILAQQFGTVESITPLATLCGHGLRIRYDNGIMGSYCHFMKATFLVPGDRVRPGQVIGYSGDTGNSAAPHLHYSMWSGATAFDPFPHVSALIREGDDDMRLEEIRTALHIRGYIPGEGPVMDEVDTIAVEMYQSAADLAVDGVIGPITLSSIVRTIGAMQHRQGDRGKRVVATKKSLVEAGFRRRVGTSDRHGFWLTRQIKKYQTARGLTADGVVGWETRMTLGEETR